MLLNGFEAVALHARALPCYREASWETNVGHWVPSMMTIAKLLGGALLAVPVLGFALYSLRLGVRGLGLDLSHETYIHTPDGLLPNLAIFSHMLLGAAVMAFAPLQLITRLRLRYLWLHRMTGRVIVAASMIIALGGLIYIGIRGTVAGPLMDLGFALYGVLMLGAAVQTICHARAGEIQRHSEWALRLFVLVMGSLIFRLHYVIWYILTDGLWSNEALTGPFDQVQYVAFYLPYLILLEVWIRRRGVQFPA